VLAAALFIAVLLFPVISASDDLYKQAFLSEDASRRAHNVSGAHLGLVPAVALHSSVLISAPRYGPRCPQAVLQSGALISLLSAFLPASGLRAPPAALFP
jgi:hypothetical protein